jgi:hypothetical protein
MVRESFAPPSCDSKSYTPSEIEKFVKMVRLNLYNQDLFCGAQAILWEMEDLGLNPTAINPNNQPDSRQK